MPVLTKEKHKILRRELSTRIDNLVYLFEKRELQAATEGVKGRGHWIAPDTMCSTVGSKTELSVAIADFKTILAEIAKL